MFDQFSISIYTYNEQAHKLELFVGKGDQKLQDKFEIHEKNHLNFSYVHHRDCKFNNLIDDLKPLTNELKEYYNDIDYTSVIVNPLFFNHINGQKIVRGLFCLTCSRKNAFSDLSIIEENKLKLIKDIIEYFLNTTLGKEECQEQVQKF